jgi:hyperosmotically inducible protein
MKRHLPLILSAVSVLTLAASAEDKPASQPVPAERLNGAARSSSIIGMTVKNPQDETLGKVTDFVLDVASGRIVAVIVATGGFLGIDDELSAVPPAALQFNPGRDTLVLGATKATLAHAPHFSAGAWPDFAHTGYAEGIYRAYQLEPYFTTAADNTGRNAPGSAAATLTPFDQGSSKNDMAITTQIRRDVIALNNLSVNARNVKIITLNGRVTLRGLVNSADEKRHIGDIAIRLTRAKNVDNQLEVKPAAAAAAASN